MRVYIAADSHLQDEVRALRDELVKHGIEVTSRWVDAKLEAHHPVSEAVIERAAYDNFSDIDRAVFLIAYNPEKRHKSGTGGRHVELGYALAKSKMVLYVGERLENCFHRHCGVKWVVAPNGTDVHTFAGPLIMTIRRIWHEIDAKPSDR